jgi:hypothetical protein
MFSILVVKKKKKETAKGDATALDEDPTAGQEIEL